MKKVLTSYILYSRTLLRDYRWIFLDERIEITDKDILNHDIDDFEKNRLFYLQNNHLFVRKLNNCIAIYKMRDTGKNDLSSRKIYSLSGIVFFEDQYENLLGLFSSILANCFLNWDFEEKGSYDMIDEKKYIFNYPISKMYTNIYLNNNLGKSLMIKSKIEEFLINNESNINFLICEQDGKLNVSKLVDSAVDKNLYLNKRVFKKKITKFRKHDKY